MKKKSIFLFSISLIVFMSSCSKDKTLQVYDEVISSVGGIQLTSSKKLKGNKEKGIDDYTGNYKAKYEDFTGVEYLFGGTNINREAGNQIKITCKLKVDEGCGKLLFISGSKELEELLVDTGECIEALELPAGGNYIYILKVKI